MQSENFNTCKKVSCSLKEVAVLLYHATFMIKTNEVLRNLKREEGVASFCYAKLER